MSVYIALMPVEVNDSCLARIQPILISKVDKCVDKYRYS